MTTWPIFALLLLAAPEISGGPPPPETKDRLGELAMEALVARPLELVRAGRVAAAEAAFDKLLRFRAARHGAGDQADLLTAFGVGLYEEGSLQDDDKLLGKAVEYLRRAVAAARLAWGDHHPETALALHSYASVLIQTADGAPPAEVDALLAESIAIRRETLGPANPETVAAVAELAKVRTEPGRIKDKGVDSTAALLRELAAILPVEGYDGQLSDSFAVRERLAELYVVNGRIEDAVLSVAEARRLDQGYHMKDGRFGCLIDENLGLRLARMLDREGLGARAAAVRAQFPRQPNCGLPKGR